MTKTAATRTSRTTTIISPKLNHFIYIYIRLVIQRMEDTFATKKKKKGEKNHFIDV